MLLVAYFSFHRLSKRLTKNVASLGRRASSETVFLWLTVRVSVAANCPVSLFVLSACRAPSRLASTPQA